jgi:hypothetical protein
MLATRAGPHEGVAAPAEGARKTLLDHHGAVERVARQVGDAEAAAVEEAIDDVLPAQELRAGFQVVDVKLGVVPLVGRDRLRGTRRLALGAAPEGLGRPHAGEPPDTDHARGLGLPRVGLPDGRGVACHVTLPDPRALQHA